MRYPRTMKIYKIKSGILIGTPGHFYLLEGEDWDAFINDDDLYNKVKRSTIGLRSIDNSAELLENELLPPIQSQEIWASGVTYINSKLGREEESRDSGGSSFYARVYEADRPELFFKSPPYRAVGNGGKVRVRADSSWNVPEPELTLMLSSSGKIIGYTIGNDMSSRSIEGENPLYLPQAKSYDGSTAIGPCIWVQPGPLDSGTTIRMVITRDGAEVFAGEISLGRMKRKLQDLASYLYRECSFPYGSLLMTGTGIVPGPDFTLKSGDKISISIEPIGVLTNTVA